jgi:alkylation response protein AidB-like acyl-CoA dehydrogenase
VLVAVDAAFAIVMARTGGGSEDAATLFLVDAGTPGFEVGRVIPTLDSAAAGGHAAVRFSGCEVPAEAVLGEPGQGFRHAQVRLAPARLTHCMRFLGLAQRALDVALDRSAEREAFGARLDALGLAQQLIADSVIDLESSRALVRRCAELLDAGAPARAETSIAKVHVAEAVGRVIDRAVQLCGGLGVSHELPLARFLLEARGFRIYDGPSETHRFAIARRAVRRRAAERAGSS